MLQRKRKAAGRRRKSAPVELVAEDPPPPPESKCSCRGVGRMFGGRRRYEFDKDLLTLHIHSEGKFRPIFGRRMYVGGVSVLVDYLQSDYLSMLFLAEMCGDLGLNGLCYYYYKKPGSNLTEGLVQLRTDADVVEMCRYVKVAREIDFYVTKPEKKKVDADGKSHK